ncbi:MAG: DUF1007 family protein [Aestuariivita sp.]|nr:DUF1007 family protein [Aestuariivita sp.]MCY4203172.1 DUF1007 family protein [Aestuariivita sp.]
MRRTFKLHRALAILSCVPRRFFFSIFWVSAVIPTAIFAHPHVFVETSIRLVLDGTTEVVGVEVSWSYDEFYSMLTFEDMGLDRDYDGQLTLEELKRLDGFDLRWVEGFSGDVFLQRGAENLALGTPEGRGVVVQGARIISTHYRPLNEPISADGLRLKAYDPTYYTYYELNHNIDAGNHCNADIVVADLKAAQSVLEERLSVIPITAVETDFPEIGEVFADTALIQCSS